MKSIVPDNQPTVATDAMASLERVASPSDPNKSNEHEINPATNSDTGESSPNASPVRRLFESALREGPLFRPEGVVADKVSETAGEAAAEKYLAKAKGNPDPGEPLSQTSGWIFVAASLSKHGHLRIAVSERDRTENAADLKITQLSQHLGLDSDEILRYAAFSHDAYRVLAATRKALNVFETEDRRYHCPSAVAATAIESLRDTISSRKTNFEATKISSKSESSLRQPQNLKASLPQLLIEDDRRVERHAAISSLMQETEKSLSDASQLLDGTKPAKRNSQGRRQFPGMIWRRGRRDENREAVQTKKAKQPKLGSQGILTAPVVQTMEQAIMRREASQYLNQRRVEMKRVVILTFTGVSAICAVLLTVFGPWPASLAIAGALGLGAIASVTAHVRVKRRYARPTSVWKEILSRPIPAPR